MGNSSSSSPVGTPNIVPEDQVRKAMLEAGSLPNLADKFSINKIGIGQFSEEKPVHLGYFGIRALGELPRLILEVSGYPYISTYYGFAPFVKDKASLPGGKLPVLFNYDGKGNNMGQSSAITRFLAIKTGLAGPTVEDHANCDFHYEMYRDCFKNDFGGHKFSADNLKSGTPSGQDPVLKEMSTRGVYTPFQTAYAGLRFFEDTLKGTDEKDFICGPFLSYVDLAMWMTLDSLDQTGAMPTWSEDLKLPKLRSLKTRIDNHPNMKAYLASDRLAPSFVPGEYSYQSDSHVNVPPKSTS